MFSAAILLQIIQEQESSIIQGWKLISIQAVSPEFIGNYFPFGIIYVNINCFSFLLQINHNNFGKMFFNIKD